MKIWISILVLGFLALIMIMLIGVVDAAPGLSNPGALETHAEIYISGNGAFTAPNGVRYGSGSEGNPYVIENWTIDANGTDGIEIRMTTAYFRIENCLINNSTTGTDGGIKINTKAGGYGWIWNCEIYDCEKGLYFYEGNNITVNDTIVRDTNMFTYFFRVNCADIRISNCEGTNVTMICYESVGVINLRIDNCTFTNVTTWGILLNVQSKTANWNVTIEDNRFINFTVQAIYVMGSYFYINNNTFLDVAALPSRTNIISINSHNSTISYNHLSNATGYIMDGIVNRGPDNLISYNTLVNCTFVGIQSHSNVYRGDRTTISNNTIWTNYTTWPPSGLGAIYLSDAVDCIVEYNWIHNHTAVGIGTDRYTNPARLIIRYNNVDGSLLRDIIMEHYTQNATIYSNIARDGFYAFVDEGNDTHWYDNYAINHTIGLLVQGIRGVWENNTVVDCEYGLVVIQGGHGYQSAQSTGNDTQCYNNIITNAEYGWAFVKYVLSMYPANSTIYNNTIDANTTDVIFAEFDGGEYVFTLKNIETFVWNTTNFIINSTSTHHLYCENITGDEFSLAVIWNSSGVIFHPPTSWERIRVQDITGNSFVDWTEGSVIFGAQEDHEYIITNNPVSDSSQSPDSVRGLLPFMMSVGVVIITVGAIAYVVVRPFSEMSRRVRS